MADMFDDMAVNKDQGQQVKSNEITGKRFQFHSLPKEYQDWHNNYYLIEKQGPIDNNAVSKAILNGYSWKTVGDGAFYGILATVSTIGAILNLKLTDGIFGFFISALFFIPVMIYISFHFAYYGMIRAQIIGPVTKSSAESTTYRFYQTFGATYISLMVMFVFLISFSEDLLILLFMLIKKMDDLIINGTANIVVTWTYNFLIWFHNFVIEVISGDGSLFESIYMLTFLFTGFAIIMIYFTEEKYFKSHSINIENDVKKTKNNQLYPIESAQEAMKEWRLKHGI